MKGAEQACGNIDRFLEGKEIVGVEIPCLLPIPEKGVVITGIIDLVYRDRKTGELVVVDYKTGAFHDEYRWQLSVYGHCAGTRRLTVVLPGAAGAHAVELVDICAIAGRTAKNSKI